MKKKNTYIVYHYLPGVYGRPLDADVVTGLVIGWPVMHYPVAMVNADTLNEVYATTQHVERNWLTYENVIPLVRDARSTSIGDVILQVSDDENAPWKVVSRFSFADLAMEEVATIENIAGDLLDERAEQIRQMTAIPSTCEWCGKFVYGSSPYCSDECELLAEEAEAQEEAE